MKIITSVLIVSITSFSCLCVQASPFASEKKETVLGLEGLMNKTQIPYVESDDILRVLRDVHAIMTIDTLLLTSVFLTKTQGSFTEILSANSMPISAGNDVVVYSRAGVVKLSFSEKEVSGVFVSGDLGHAEFKQVFSIDDLSSSEIYSISSGGTKYRIILVK